MNEESSNPNIEWKKPGFDFNEKITLKTNVRKAVEYEAQNKNSGVNKAIIWGKQNFHERKRLCTYKVK